jgi:hypothetical protein
MRSWINFDGVGGAGAPSDSGYTKIYSTSAAFAAPTTRGRTCASMTWTTPRRDWPVGFKSGKGMPSWINFDIAYAFAALKADGSIIAWARSSHGGTSAPSGSGYTKIYSTSAAFAALKADETPLFYCFIYCFLPVICQ